MVRRLSSIIERCRSILGVTLRARFIRLVGAPIIRKFLDSVLLRCLEAEGLTTLIDDDALIKVMKSINNSRYIESVLKEWREEVSDISKRTKTKLKWTNPSTRLEECKKLKLKAHTSLNGPSHPLEDGVRCQWCTYERCGYYLREGFCSFCNSEAGNSFVYDSNPNSFNDPPKVFTHPLQPQYDTYSYELCGNDSHYGYDYPPRFPLESSIPLNEITSQIPPITPVLPTLEPEDSLSMGDEDLSTIPEKESDKVIKSSVEDLVPILSESEDTSGSDSECDSPSCNDFSPIIVSEEKSMTFSNPLFDSNEDFTSSDDESLSVKDVPEDNVKIYSHPLFEFDDEYISSDINPLFDEVLENIERGEFDEIEACLTSDSIPPGINGADFDPEEDILLLEKLLNDDISFPLPLKELHFEGLNIPPDSEEFLDRDPRSLEDEPDKDDLKNIVKDCPDFKDSRARCFVHRSLDLQSFACLYMGIRYP
ncbi:gag-pol polyprotein [Tanacetum coccineum]